MIALNDNLYTLDETLQQRWNVVPNIGTVIVLIPIADSTSFIEETFVNDNLCTTLKHCPSIKAMMVFIVGNIGLQSFCAGAQWRRCHWQNDDNFMRWLDIFRKKFSIVLSPHITIFVRYFIFVLKLQPSWLTLLNARRAFEQVSFKWWFSRIVHQRYSEVTQGCYLYSDGYSIIK